MYADRRYSIDWASVLGRLIKYICEGSILAFAAWVIPKSKLDLHEIITIGLVAASSFAVADTVSPTIASSARMGSGLYLGARVASIGGKL